MRTRILVCLVLIIAIIGFTLQFNPAKAFVNSGYIEGWVKDANTNAPIVGSTLKLMSGSTEMPAIVYMSTLGYYDIEYLPGSYTLVASKEGYLPQADSVVILANQYTIQDIALTPGSLNTVPEIPFGTIVASLAMAVGLLGFVAVPKLRRRIWQ